MESRLWRALLKSGGSFAMSQHTGFAGAAALLSLCLLNPAAKAAEAPSDIPSPHTNDALLEAIVQPDIERRELEEAKVDTENFEFGLFGGVQSFEDFGSNDVYGLRLAFHITEDWFLETSYGISSLQLTSYERLTNFTPLLTDKDRELQYYNLNLGFNLMPGEIYLFKWAFNSAFYVTGGAGNSLFADSEYFTYNFGAGLRVFMTDWLTLRWDMRNHLLTHALFGDDREIQNLEASLGVSVFF